MNARQKDGVNWLVVNVVVGPWPKDSIGFKWEFVLLWELILYLGTVASTNNAKHHVELNSPQWEVMESGIRNVEIHRKIKYEKERWNCRSELRVREITLVYFFFFKTFSFNYLSAWDPPAINLMQLNINVLFCSCLLRAWIGCTSSSPQVHNAWRRFSYKLCLFSRWRERQKL